ncbi:MAG: hypothetical protein DWP97_10960 [Calditrichaeota bacterium]|nr:MAG: hypothetical protein DWP97_10960 [Calditrichota bacterium]
MYTLKYRLILTLFLFTAFFAADVSAVSSNVGTSSFPFLKINISARAVAMGGAFTGLADDESALYYNPAGIASFEQKRYILGYHNYFYDMQNGFVGIIKPAGNSNVYGLYIGYLNYGTFTETEENTGNVLGDFSGGDLVFAFSFAHKKSHQLSFGGTAKFIYEKIQDYSATGAAVDLGIKYISDRGKFGAGLTIQNLGAQLSALGEEKDKLPTAIRGGVSYKPKGLFMTLVSDVVLPFDNDPYIALGTDYHKFKPLFLRLGWNSFGSNYRTAESEDSWAGLSFGAGFEFRNMQLSYSFSPEADLGESHRITITGEL